MARITIYKIFLSSKFTAVPFFFFFFLGLGRSVFLNLFASCFRDPICLIARRQNLGWL